MYLFAFAASSMPGIVFSSKTLYLLDQSSTARFFFFLMVDLGKPN
jgi:hypothetical protein